jgi:hypothetical protein
VLLLILKEYTRRMYKGFCILTVKHSDCSVNMVESRRKKKRKRVEVTTKRPGTSRESLQNEEASNMRRPPT